MIAIVKYNAGNIRSVQNALNRLGCESIITDDPALIRSATKVIFPGVGEASSAMQYLREHNLVSLLTSLTQPMLGICLGLQLMCEHSEEGDTDCLGIFNAKVKRFPPEELVPHMGWNNFSHTESPLFKGITLDQDMYYVHAYYAEQCEHTIATCSYISTFSTAMNKDKFYGTQFHPEKSSEVGQQLLQNFLAL